MGKEKQMSEIIQGDAVQALLDDDIDLLLHVCNDQGVMGSGIALTIKNRIPAAFAAYREYYELGAVSFGEVEETQYAYRGVFNLVAQAGYGQAGSNRFLNYGALAECLTTVADYCNSVQQDLSFRFRIGIPVCMGSFRAGGDWEIVKEMCDFMLRHHEVVYYDFNKG